MSSGTIVKHRNLVGTMSEELLLNATAATNRGDNKPPADNPVLQRLKFAQLSRPLENSHVNLKKHSEQTSLTDFIHSLFSGKKRVEHIFGDKKAKHMNASCPNLNNREFTENKYLRGPVDNLQRDTPKLIPRAKTFTPTDGVSMSGSSFPAPNIFITSLSRSQSDDNCRLETTKTDNKTPFCKSSSVLPQRSQNEADDQKTKWRQISAVMTGDFYYRDGWASSQRHFYRDENIAQITPYLFVGREEAANDQRILCKLDIHSLIDITNAPRKDHHMNLECPCTCPSKRSHVHPKLYVHAEDTETGFTKDHFSIINKFVDGSRELGRGTLIFSACGRSRAPAAAIQYLVTQQGMTVNEAYRLLKRQWPDTDVKEGFLNRLLQFENIKSIDRKVSPRSINDPDNCSGSVSIRPQVKNAWAEYSI